MVPDPDADPFPGFVSTVLPELGGYRDIRRSWGTRGTIKAAAAAHGLEVDEYPGGIQVLRRDGRTIGMMHKMVSSLVPLPVAPLCRDKESTSAVLRGAGLPVPATRSFRAAERAEAVEYALGLGRAVVKPRDGRAGAGVAIDLTERVEVEAAWDAAQQLDPAGVVLVEEHVVGMDVRVTTVGARAAGVCVRLPRFVVGDGVRPIPELVQEHRARRHAHAHFREGEFPPLGTVLEDRVPARGEVVLLGRRAIMANAETAELLGTGRVHQEHLELALQVARALGTGMCGVDLIVADPSRPGGAVINEVNTSPNLRLHHFPAYGASSDVAGAIVAEMISRAEHGLPSAGWLADTSPEGGLRRRFGLGRGRGRSRR
ncbi:hypothetical protein [Serinicoccus kebangsaanensis]|uniref:hypothetical protein n=1 Tax=Serinicoccus kebangsaanensis TaxID=2602069 RepID=UPI00124C1D5D|nr:hypothetical protein [Serinicoccus kebangsaanensis]